MSLLLAASCQECFWLDLEKLGRKRDLDLFPKENRWEKNVNPAAFALGARRYIKPKAVIPDYSLGPMNT